MSIYWRINSATVQVGQTPRCDHGRRYLKPSHNDSGWEEKKFSRKKEQKALAPTLELNPPGFLPTRNNPFGENTQRNLRVGLLSGRVETPSSMEVASSEHATYLEHRKSGVIRLYRPIQTTRLSNSNGWWWVGRKENKIACAHYQ